MSVGDIVACVAGGDTRHAEVSYINADGDAVTVSLGRVDPASVVRGRPVRDVKSRAGQRNYSGLFWCATTQTHLCYESLLERDRLLLADFDPAVRWVACQSFWLRGPDGSAFRQHVPDVLLEHRDGGYSVVDVKAPWFLEKPEVAAVLEWTGRVCRSRGWRYEVWTGGNPTEVSNVRVLSMARRSAVIDRAATEAVAAVARDGMTIDMLRGLAVRDGVTRQSAFVAVLERLWSGAWFTDLSSPLTGDSVVTIVSGAA